jgi:hypothetical protein
MQALSPHSETYKGYKIEDSWSSFCTIYKNNKPVWQFQKLEDWSATRSEAERWIDDTRLL